MKEGRKERKKEKQKNKNINHQETKFIANEIHKNMSDGWIEGWLIKVKREREGNNNIERKRRLDKGK